MKRLLIVAALAGLAVTPARATEPVVLSVEHYAPIPCTIACAYWDGASAAGFNECASPFPPGSYDVSVLRITDPSGVVEIEATSVVDYDTFVCTNTEPSMLIMWTGCSRSNRTSCIGEPCNGVAGIDAIAVGCTERHALTMNGIHAANDGLNDEFLLISYNWSDYAPLPITISGPAEIVDDSYEAVPA